MNRWTIQSHKDYQRHPSAVCRSEDDDNGTGQVDDRDDPDVHIVTVAASLTALDAPSVERRAADRHRIQPPVRTGDMVDVLDRAHG